MSSEIMTADIEKLRDEAIVAGDSMMSATCTRALNGSERDWKRAEEAILDARAQADES